MTYAVVIPPKYLGALVAIREATGVSIRRQIMDAIETWLAECKQEKDLLEAYLKKKGVIPCK